MGFHVRAFARPWGGALPVIGGQALQSLANFLTGLALGRGASQEDLGTYALGLSFCFLVLSLGDTLVATPYTYFRARGEADGVQLFNVALLASLALGLLIGAGFGLFHALSDHLLADLWPVLPVAILCLVLREFLRRHFYAIGRQQAALLLDVFGACAQLGILALLWHSGTLNAANVFWGLATASLLALLLCLPLAGAPLQRPTAMALREHAGAFLGYGGWLVLGGLCHVASTQLYPWLAMAGGGKAQAGLFAACLALTNLLNPLLVALTNFFRPRFIHEAASTQGMPLVRFALRNGVPFLVPALALFLLVSLAGETLLTRVYGPDYAAGAPALRFFAAGLLAVAAAAPLQLGLLALRVPASNFAYHGVNLCVLLALAAAFGASLGLGRLGLVYCLSNTAGLLVLGAAFLWFARTTTTPRQGVPDAVRATEV